MLNQSLLMKVCKSLKNIFVVLYSKISLCHTILPDHQLMKCGLHNQDCLMNIQHFLFLAFMVHSNRLPFLHLLIILFLVPLPTYSFSPNVVIRLPCILIGLLLLYNLFFQSLCLFLSIFGTLHVFVFKCDLNCCTTTFTLQ